MQVENDKNTIIEFNYFYHSKTNKMDLKTSKTIEDINNTINKIDFIELYQTLNSNNKGHTSISSVHGIVKNINQSLGHKQKMLLTFG